ncbi:MAG TPA: YciI family protein, partial [Candidatus Dormibacteraeota bacterium]
KYMLLITQGEWQANGSAEDRDRAMEKVMEWWGKQFGSGKMVGGQQLQPPDTATTVVIERGKHTILDRPLMEAKEAIGGFGILDVADLDEALAIVKTMPQPDGRVEVRPIIDRGR